MGRGDLSLPEIRKLMEIPLRGEITPVAALSPPPLSTDYEEAIRYGSRYF
jgi:hypothetical protein